MQKYGLVAACLIAGVVISLLLRDSVTGRIAIALGVGLACLTAWRVQHPKVQ